MSYPKRKEIAIAILEELHVIGGEGKTNDVYTRVAKHFPMMTAEDLTYRFGIGEKKWTNMVRWAKLTLIQNGEVVGPSRGVWTITDKGRQRIGEKP